MKLAIAIWGTIVAVLAVRGLIAFGHDGIPAPIAVLVMIAALGAFWLID